MLDRQTTNTYVIISPVKNEEKYVETTIRGVLGQTVRPIHWVIVDDASRDNTLRIISRYAEKTPWIKVLRMEREANRQPGAPVIQAFAAGYKLIRSLTFDFVVKLDCDLDFAENYFEQLMARFVEDDKLGIASGIYLEKNENGWLPVRIPAYHAAGASKMVRRKCFDEIGGFVPSCGWDTVDEIRAQTLGWRTRHFEELRFYHLKNEGSAIGFFRTSLMHGEVFYLTGGGNLFFLLKVLHRMLFGRPFFLRGVAMLLGFLKPWISRRPRLVNDAEARFYQQLLNRRLVESVAARLVGEG